MKQVFFLLLTILVFSTNVFSQDYIKSITKFQKELNEEFKNPEESPLTTKDRKDFKGLNFFPIDEK